MLFQHQDSPLNLARLAGKPLPLVRFGDTNPVYFDRHTLSVKDGQLSMYTLDGRMRFALALTPLEEANFKEKKLREVLLACRPDGVFELSFQFSDGRTASPMKSQPMPPLAASAHTNHDAPHKNRAGV